LKLLAGAPESGTELPFSNRTVKALSGFAVVLEKLIELSHELDPVKLFDAVVEKSGYKQYITGMADGEERWENILELRGVAGDYKDMPTGEGLTAFLEGVALVSDVDALPERQETVTLITLHQAKGLEFPVVFIVGMEDGIIPHYKSIDDAAQLEEERRLCYVGITRAKKKVYLVRAFRRHLMGSSAVNKPSRFLQDIPSHLISRAGAKEETEWMQEPTIKAEEEPRELPEFKAGDRVRHEQFGEGMVVSYRRVKNDAEVAVAFDGVGVKRFLLSFARLEKV
jgi:DNA helicase-2/ATP-dependent DNA helicase PcrA